jgi:hypothetical protein
MQTSALFSIFALFERYRSVVGYIRVREVFDQSGIGVTGLLQCRPNRPQETEVPVSILPEDQNAEPHLRQVMLKHAGLLAYYAEEKPKEQ